MPPKPLPSAERLRALLDYDPEEGMLTWRHRPAAMFTPGRYSSDRLARSWNGANAGRPALDCPTSTGYLHGAIDWESFLAHRIIWKLVTGEEPDEIDHADGDRANNRWANLRNVSHAENMKNRGLSRRNKSGVCGVCWNAKKGRWYAFIWQDGNNRPLGFFVHFDDAVDARARAEQRLGFHSNHGKRSAAHARSSSFSSHLRAA